MTHFFFLLHLFDYQILIFSLSDFYIQIKRLSFIVTNWRSDSIRERNTNKRNRYTLNIMKKTTQK